MKITANGAFGEDFKKWREQEGYTQRELSKLTGVSERAILRIEKGRLPTISTLLTIAEAVKSHKMDGSEVFCVVF